MLASCEAKVWADNKTRPVGEINPAATGHSPATPAQLPETVALLQTTIIPPAVETAKELGPKMGEKAERHALHQDIARAIDQLPANQRQVMILGPVQGYSYEEIGQKLDVPTHVVKSRLHRAREKMREIVGVARN